MKIWEQTIVANFNKVGDFFSPLDSLRATQYKKEKIKYKKNIKPNFYTKTICVDIETDGLDFKSCNIEGVGISFNNTEYIWLDEPAIIECILKEALEMASIVVFHNARFDVFILERIYEIYISRFKIRDTMLLSYVLEPGNDSHSLKHLAKQHLNIVMEDYESAVNTNNLSQYCIKDCHYTLELFRELFNKIDKNLIPILRLEHQVLEVLLFLDKQTFIVDMIELDRVEEDIKTKIESYTITAKQIAENEINLNSPNQLLATIHRLCPDLDIKSTDYDTIAQHRNEHMFINLLYQIKREQSKIGNSVKQLRANTDVNSQLKVNLIQIATRTGRLASRNPNLQNIPKATRKAVKPKPGYSFVSIDYSQCELRILASLSGEPTLLDAFNNSSDPHAEVTAKLLGIPVESVNPENRKIGKTLNFGIIYGMEKYLLARKLQIELTEAEKLLDNYWTKFLAIRQWLFNNKVTTIKNGYSQTLLGRRRYYHFDSPELCNLKNKSDNTIESFLIKHEDNLPYSDKARLREAGNHPIQGGNADLTKLAMVKIQQEILPSFSGARLFLQIHDELIFEVSDVHLHSFTKLVSQAMMDINIYNVPLQVEAKYGKYWQ